LGLQPNRVNSRFLDQLCYSGDRRYPPAPQHFTPETMGQLSKTGVAVEKLFFTKLPKTKLRQDAL
jgi:hypothetical protein